MTPIALALGALLLSGGSGEQAGETRVDAEAALAASVVDALILQSDVDWHRGDYHRASKGLLAASYLDAAYIDGQVSAAWLAWSWGASAVAVRILERVVILNPDDPYALHESAVQAEMQGEVDRAIAWETRAHEADPEDALIGITLAGFLRGQERWAEAAEVYRDVLEANPGNHSAIRYLERYEAHGHMRAEPESEPEPETPAAAPVEAPSSQV